MDLDFLTRHVFWAWVLYVVKWGIRLSCLVVIPYRRPPATAKAWLLLIFFLPLLGLLLFAILGRAKLPRYRQALIDRIPHVFADLSKRMAHHPNIHHPNIHHPRIVPELEQAVLLAENLGHLPILGGNQAELLTHYEELMIRLAADIDAAQNHVHLLFYIFAADDTTAAVLAALQRAVQRGVVCRVLIDYVGSRAYRKALIPRLRGMGVQIHEMLKASLLHFRKAHYDLRNHRKMAIIDARVG